LSGRVKDINFNRTTTVVFQHYTYQDHPTPPLYRRSSDKNVVFPYSSDCSLAKLLAPLSLWPGEEHHLITCSIEKTGINYNTFL